jgi:hypothetical protein
MQAELAAEEQETASRGYTAGGSLNESDHDYTRSRKEQGRVQSNDHDNDTVRGQIGQRK